MHSLDRLFSPRSIAVIGASRTRGKLGHDVLRNIVDHGFAGKVYPVNPHAKRILKRMAYASVTDIPHDVDVAVIIVPAETVATVLEDCGKKQIPFAVIISAGFKEVGKKGAHREEELQRIARKYRIRIVGPNCLGFINAHHKLNASFAAGMPKQGNVALISQSGAMGVAMLDWAHKSRVGFSYVISIGNKADIDEVECLEFLAHDPHTSVIMLYAESIEQGRAFMHAASRITPHKPVVLLKAGLSTRAQHAIQSHTGSLAGSEEALTAACKKAGIIRVRTIKEFFDAALVLSFLPLPEGNRVAIITNAGGPGIMAVDTLPQTQLTLPTLSAQLQKTLKKELPAAANTHNPIDVIGDATPERYEHALHEVLSSDEVDSVLVILTPQLMTHPAQVAQIIVDTTQHYHKPVVASFIGGTAVEHARTILEQHQIPHFTTPERAIGALDILAQQASVHPTDTSHDEMDTFFALPFKTHRIQLSTQEAEQLLQEYAMPVLASHLVRTTADCKKIAFFPIVMKVASRDVIHKAAVGGVKLHIQTPQDAAHAFTQIKRTVLEHQKAKIDGMLIQPDINTAAPRIELIIGMKRDDAFGPVMMCGMGGSLVELFGDVRFGIAPLTRIEARKMLLSLRAHQLLHGYDIETAVSILVALSHLSLDYPEITAIDLNPVVLYESGKGGIIIDARMMRN